MKRNFLGKLFKKSNSLSSPLSSRKVASTNSLKSLLTASAAADAADSSSLSSNDEPAAVTTTATSSATDTRLERLKQEHFTCVCCFEIMREPVTLMCGHSLCQLCLANWFLSSASQKCLTCRQEWTGVPKVNIALRSTIEELISTQQLPPAAAAAATATTPGTSKALDKSEAERVIHEFEDKCLQAMLTKNLSHQHDVPFPLGRNRRPHGGGGGAPAIGGGNAYIAGLRLVMHLLMWLCFIVVLMFGLVGFWLNFFIYPFFYGNSGGGGETSTTTESGPYVITTTTIHQPAQPLPQHQHLLKSLFEKPVDLWSQRDTEEWLDNLGPWAAAILEAARQLNLDGAKLLLLSEQMLADEPFNVQDEFVRRYFLDSIKMLNASSYFQARDIWELKNQKRFQMIFMPLYFSMFPRVSTLTAYLFQYKSLFLPLKHAYEAMSGAKSNYNNNNVQNMMDLHAASKDESSNVLFLLKLMLFPYLSMSDVIFNSHVYTTNMWISLKLVLDCYLLTYVELVYLVECVTLRRNANRAHLLNKKLNFDLVANLKRLCVFFVLYIVWPILPNFVTSALFLYVLFLKSFVDVLAAFRRSRRHIFPLFGT